VREFSGYFPKFGEKCHENGINEKMNTQEIETSVLRCLFDHYGIEGTISRLPGENLNYLVNSDRGERYIFEIVDDDMPPEVVALEFQAIEHAISGALQFNLPRIVKNSHGKIETGIELHKNISNRARLLTFIDGILLEKIIDISEELRENLGKSLAEFDLVMQDFDHPAAHRNHRWNLAEAGQHKAKMALIEDMDQRKLLAWAFDLWASDARPKLPALPHQIIHGDAHGENVLVQGERVSGLVDFGDCCFNPTVCELGVCLPYLMMRQDHPLQVAADVVAAYRQVKPLSKLERTVLYPLICGRLAVTVSIAAERRQIDPNHPNWFVGDAEAWNLLQFLFDARPVVEKILSR
jgi:Ser/Thr protein kinase RdoA (MazF antagonist)